jgi:hypothetical protein
MKKTMVRLGLLAAIVLAASVLGSCSLKAVSIADRIGDFVASLNGDRSDTHNHFQAGSAGSFTNGAYWDTLLTLSTKPYTYTTPNPANPAQVDVTVTGANAFAYNFRFIMVNTGAAPIDNWMIQHMELPPGTPLL